MLPRDLDTLELSNLLRRSTSRSRTPSLPRCSPRDVWGVQHICASTFIAARGQWQRTPRNMYADRIDPRVEGQPESDRERMREVLFRTSVVWHGACGRRRCSTVCIGHDNFWQASLETRCGHAPILWTESCLGRTPCFDQEVLRGSVELYDESPDEREELS